MQGRQGEESDYGRAPDALSLVAWEPHKICPSPPLQTQPCHFPAFHSSQGSRHFCFFNAMSSILTPGLMVFPWLAPFDSPAAIHLLQEALLDHPISGAQP